MLLLLLWYCRKRAIGLYAESLRWQYATLKLALKASRDRDVISVASVDYLMYAGYFSLANHFLYMEHVAQKALNTPGS